MTHDNLPSYSTHIHIPKKWSIKWKHTYLLTPWCRVLPQQLTGLQLVKKFPAFHGTRRFITALTSVRHLSLSWASPIQSVYPHPTTHTHTHTHFIFAFFTVQKTIWCNSTSNASDDGRMCPKHVELRIHP